MPRRVIRRARASRYRLDRKISRIVATRLAGGVVGTAGLALMGLGTLATPVVIGAPAAASVSASVICPTGNECINQGNVPTSGNQSGCADVRDFLGTVDPSDSYWHFVIPHTKNSQGGFLFQSNAATPGGPDEFIATFNAAPSEYIVHLVQSQPGHGAGFKGIVVETEGGLTLTGASIPDGGTNELTEYEGDGPEAGNGQPGDFNLSGSCVSSGTTTTTSATSSSTHTTSTSTSTSTSTHTTTTSSSTQTTTTTSSSHSTTTTSTTHTTTTVPVSTTTTTTTHTTSTTPVTTSTSTTTRTTETAPGSSTTSTNTTPGTTVTSSQATPTTGVQAATTPGTGAGGSGMFGLGLGLLITGSTLLFGARPLLKRFGK